MKKVLFIGLITIGFILALTNISNANQYISCHDENMYNALLEEIGEDNLVQHNGAPFYNLEITDQNLSNIKEIDLSGKGIKDIKGVESLTNLHSINLSDNEISDISYLHDLNLTYVNLNNNNISDLAPLYRAELEDQILGELYVSGNNLTKLDSVAQITSLSVLDVSNNAITNISPLTGIESLTTLVVSNNPTLRTLEGFEGLEKLKIFTAKNCNITNIGNIFNIASLENLDLSNNKITAIKTPTIESTTDDDGNTVPGTALRQINLSYNQLEAADFLRPLVFLNSVNLSNNKIKNVPEFLINQINNNSLTMAKIDNQKLYFYAIDEELPLTKNSDYTNLLYWGYTLKSDLELSVENGTVENYVFKFEDKNKEGKITIENGVFAGTEIVIASSSSNVGNRTGNTTTNTTNTNTATSNTTGTNTTNSSSSNTTTVITESGSGTTASSDGTTANGKMPYTGITSKMVGILGLVAALVGVVIYTEIQNQKRKRK